MGGAHWAIRENTEFWPRILTYRKGRLFPSGITSSCENSKSGYPCGFWVRATF